MNKVFALGEIFLKFITKENSTDYQISGNCINFLALFSNSQIQNYLISYLGNDDNSFIAYNLLCKTNINTKLIYYKKGTQLPTVDVLQYRDGTKSTNYHIKKTSILHFNYNDIDTNMFDNDDILYINSFLSAFNLNFLYQQEHLCQKLFNNLIIYFEANINKSPFKKKFNFRTPKLLFPYIDILKVTLNELFAICECNDLKNCIDYLFNTWPNISYIIVSQNFNYVSLYTFNKVNINQKYLNCIDIYEDIGGSAFLLTLINSFKLNKRNLRFVQEDILKKALKNYVYAVDKTSINGDAFIEFSYNDLNDINC